ncbi:hypothetical protein AAJ76_1830002193 [Vairimorpha ceranae]|uniref:Uncharacterized protein n=1 Tax=Vairimorpha ceranae TaxID=40302 RepID=A0A0F9W840_9MICR|nr:hypothetical protein AAJ76_1830002193 [Vairimorpha ceranae]KKO73896.1 hypothetical protein AAJ76_1830002193 [Vairimorpha ceranae]
MKNLEEKILNFKFNDVILLENSKTLELFLKYNLIKTEIPCVKCDGRMRIMVAAMYIDGYAYRCSSKACRSRESFKKGSKMGTRI